MIVWWRTDMVSKLQRLCRLNPWDTDRHSPLLCIHALFYYCIILRAMLEPQCVFSVLFFCTWPHNAAKKQSCTLCYVFLLFLCMWKIFHNSVLLYLPLQLPLGHKQSAGLNAAGEPCLNVQAQSSSTKIQLQSPRWLLNPCELGITGHFSAAITTFSLVVGIKMPSNFNSTLNPATTWISPVSLKERQYKCIQCPCSTLNVNIWPAAFIGSIQSPINHLME